MKQPGAMANLPKAKAFGFFLPQKTIFCIIP